MGFYDNCNFDGLKLLSKIKNQNSFVTEPCIEFLSVINQVKHLQPPHSITVAEIGIGFGATALPALMILEKGDIYYAFDFQDRLSDFIDDLQARNFGITCKIIVEGNSRNEWDSYSWNLSNIIFQMRKQKQAGIFDAVYLDGAHTFFHDGLAVCLLKELIKDGGFLILDDLFWTYSASPTAKEFGAARMPTNQMNDMQVLRVQEIFLSNDPNFEKLSPPNAYRGIFRKRPRRIKEGTQVT